MDNWPKLNIIIGNVVVIAAKVRVNAVFISKKSGKKKNTFSKNFCVYIIQITAKKLK
ncbi:MAG: hypothetical protein Q8S84_08150 [bacterium]|nr:hypothetical protein [bacterium]